MTSERLRSAVPALVAVVGAMFLTGFDSYKYPFERVRRDKKLQKEIREKLEKGDRASVYAEHYQISLACLRDAAVKAAVAEDIASTASDIDADNWQNPSHYEAKNHCDRAMGVSDETAFTNALRYHRERVAEAWNSLAFGDVNNFKKILPRALHDEEDFFSHSNFVDLPAPARAALVSCWTAYATRDGAGHDENNALIERDERCMGVGFAWKSDSGRLRVTGYDPKAKDPYAPPGDTYDHRRFAKDNPGYGDEAKSLVQGGTESKYIVARKAATEACATSVRDFKRSCQADAKCKPYVSLVFDR